MKRAGEVCVLALFNYGLSKHPPVGVFFILFFSLYFPFLLFSYTFPFLILFLFLYTSNCTGPIVIPIYLAKRRWLYQVLSRLTLPALFPLDTPCFLLSPAFLIPGTEIVLFYLFTKGHHWRLASYTPNGAICPTVVKSGTLPLTNNPKTRPIWLVVGLKPSKQTTCNVIPSAGHNLTLRLFC